MQKISAPILNRMILPEDEQKLLDPRSINY